MPKWFSKNASESLDQPQICVKSWLKEDGGILLLTFREKIPISKPSKEAVKQALKVAN